MSDAKQTDAQRAAEKANQLWGDLVPVLAFIILYNVIRQFPDENTLLNKDTALYWATGALIVATLGVVANYVRQKLPVPLILVFTAGIVGGFGILGILLQDKQFLFIKPTIQNLFLAALIFGSLAIGKNIWKVMFERVFNLPDFAWRTLAIRWGFFFVAMALWNEFLWRNFSEAVWANWKLGNIPIVLAFGLANTPYTMKHLREDVAEPEADA